MELTSSQGMVVRIDDVEYGELLTEYGPRAKEKILTIAGRVYKHRQLLGIIRSQKLTLEQSAQVESRAKSLAVQFSIDKQIDEDGYGAYLTRRDRGGMMPESWSRIVERASSQIDKSTISVTDSDKNCALMDLGFYIDTDLKFSERVSGWCKWDITVPEGWGGSDFKSAPLGFYPHGFPQEEIL